MDQLNKYFCICFLAMAAGSLACLASERQIGTPTQLLEVFYSCLLSDQPASELPQLFSEPKSFAAALKWPNQVVERDDKTATIIVWEYFRANKNAFLFVGIDPAMTLKKTALGYCFVGFPRDGLFINGILCAELSAPISLGGKEGVFKQVRFPLNKNSTIVGPRYLIEESMISINGIIFGPSDDFKRNGNLYEQLGIP